MKTAALRGSAISTVSSSARTPCAPSKVHDAPWGPRRQLRTLIGMASS